MSEQQTFGHEAVEQHQGYREMTVIDPVKVDDSAEIFGPDLSGVQRAADELTSRREADQTAREGRPVDMTRDYIHIGGEKSGQPKPPNETVSAEQAAHDLGNMRQAEADADQAALAAEISANIDRIRAGDFSEQQPLSEEERLARWNSLNSDQQATLVQQADAAKASAEEEIARALQESPQLIAAVEQEVARKSAQYEQARAQHEQGLVQNAQAVAAHIAARYPELQSIATDQWGTALRVLSQSGQAGQARAQAIAGELHAAQHILAQGAEAQRSQHQRVEQAYAQYQQNVQQQFSKWAEQHDAAFEQLVKDVPAAERREIEQEVRNSFAESGWTPEQVQQAWQTNPALRSFGAQKQMLEAARYRIAQRGAKAKVERKIPTVQRPGSPELRGSEDDHYIKGLEKNLNTSMSAKDAAALVVARRARARR